MNTESLANEEETEWLSPEWDAAIERKCDLDGWPKGKEPKHELVKRFTMLSSILECDDQELKQGQWTRDVVLTHAPYQSMILGADFIAAWQNHDFGFFQDLARVAVIQSGARKHAGDPIESVVIGIASELWTKEKGNPSREDVMLEAKKKGLKVGNWSKTFKRCHLAFLKGRGRGRPSKK